MKVICAGLSKTGTKSLAKALRILGLKVYDYPEHRDFHMDEWLDVYCEGKSLDFTSIYKDVDAVTDVPTAFWFQEIYEAFPDAKVVLSLRENEDIWVQSLAKQLELLGTAGGHRAAVWLAPILAKMIQFVPFTSSTQLPKLVKSKFFVERMFMAAFGSLNWKSTVLLKKKYREHNERVQAVIPKEKLLIYNVKQGWKPLCEFLECVVPDEEFPKENVTVSMAQGSVSIALQEIKRAVFILLAILAALASVFYCIDKRWLELMISCNNTFCIFYV
ncbi:uncharacterized protein LOC144646106 [Oculina patagonica]